MVCCWGIRPPQRPTVGTSGNAGLSTWDGGVENLLVDNIKACLAQPRDQGEEALATSIAHHGLADQSQNFALR